MIMFSVPDAIFAEQPRVPTSFLAIVQLLLPRQAALATFIESGWLHVPSSGTGHSLGLPWVVFTFRWQSEFCKFCGCCLDECIYVPPAGEIGAETHVASECNVRDLLGGVGARKERAICTAIAGRTHRRLNTSSGPRDQCPGDPLWSQRRAWVDWHRTDQKQT
eukprot:COSAG02_NODE_13024_length_1458_cov_1.968359_2_plen_163_part_00